MDSETHAEELKIQQRLEVIINTALIRPLTVAEAECLSMAIGLGMKYLIKG